MARVLHCVCIPVAGPRHARVHRPLRAIVRRSHDLWRRDLHGCARHAHRHARRLCGADSRARLLAIVNAVSMHRACAGWSQRSFRPRFVISQCKSSRWYVSNFIVKPNELVRERPFIAYNIDLTRQAYGLDRVTQREFPAETTVEATDPGQQSGHAAKHPAVGLARAARHAASDSGNPHLLRLSRHRHRSL